MPMQTIPAGGPGWGAVNVWPNAAGELAVRPGLRLVNRPAADGVVYAGYETFVHPHLDTTEYFAVEFDTENGDIYLRNGDPTGLLGDYRADISGRHSLPEKVWFANYEREVIIGANEFRPYGGIIGGYIHPDPAQKMPSVNSAASTLQLPAGPVVAWAGLVVYADGSTLRYSDGGEPRAIRPLSFDGGPWTGRIIDLHATLAGDLVVVAEDGIFLQDGGSAAGEYVYPSWRKMSTYRSPGPGRTCVAQGAIWGIEPGRGVRQLVPEGPTITPALPSGPQSKHAIPDTANWNAAMLHTSQEGPVLSLGHAIWRLHVATGFSSWWTVYDTNQNVMHQPDPGQFVTVARGQHGMDVFVWQRGAFVASGNMDGGARIESSYQMDDVYGTFVGRLPSAPGQSIVVREVSFLSDTVGTVHAYVRGKGRDVASGPERGSFRLGSDTWGAGTRTMRPPPLRSRRTRLNIRTNDVHLQVGAQHCQSRLGDSVSVDIRGPGRLRGTR